jgi:hypothetical protein
MPELTLDERKLELDRHNAQLDAELRRAELEEKRAQRESEHRLKELELANAVGSRFRFTAAQATVAVAVITFISAAISVGVQALTTRDTEAGKNAALIESEKMKVQGNIDLEQQKQKSAEKLARQNFEIGLILKAIGAPSDDERVRSLQFFVNAGFIEDRDGKISAMAQKPQGVPYLPIARPSSDLSGIPLPLVDILHRYEGPDLDGPSIRLTMDRVKALVKVSLNENQFSAISSFVYNMGTAALASSTLLKEINNGSFDKVPAELERWSKMGSVEVPSMLRRRREEGALFNVPVGVFAPAGTMPPAAKP